jgi:hypothetical protein
MIINGTFNNISVISWWLVLLLEKTTDMPSLGEKIQALCMVFTLGEI